MIRRDFFKYSLLTATLICSSNLNAKIPNKKGAIDTRKDIVIIGGGFAGLSCAKRLKELNPNCDVTIIEKRANFSSCPFSNSYLANLGNISYEDLNYDYNSAIEKYKYNFINECVHKIDKDFRIIYTDTKVIKYRYLVLAVGIDYDYEKLFKDEKKAFECSIKAPAGLKPGSEHLKLKKMIQNFKGGNFIISIPSGSYKCPPAPYERACMIAHYFKTNKIKAKVVILDPRSVPAAKPSKFLKAFKKYYSDYIVYKPLSNFKDIDFNKKIITYEAFNKQELDYEKYTIKFQEANIIPPNKANSLIKNSGYAVYDNGWAKLNFPTLRSVSCDFVYIVGDAQGEYPYAKSAQIANTCGYIVAEDLTKRLKRQRFDYTQNPPGNICYSMITENKSVSITNTFRFTDKVISSSSVSNIDNATYEASKAWFHGLLSDILAV